jgi:hypothetical protein
MPVLHLLETPDHLPRRPVEEEHNEVDLGSARPLRMPPNLIER